MMMDHSMWVNIMCISWDVYFSKLKNQNRPAVVIYNFMKICKITYLHFSICGTIK